MRRHGLRSAFRIPHSALVLALAACQPQSTRLLLLDLRLTHPAALAWTARPWNDAGYSVEYRRYFPHLTRADLDRYRAVIVLGGTTPESPSDALTTGDVVVLTEWLLRDGVVVLGAPNGASGSLDRWTMNQWLAWIGAGITIGSGARDSAETALALPVRETDIREVGFDPFPAGDYAALRVALRAQVIARAARREPIVAARRVGDGLVIVLSRSTLDALATTDQAAAPTEPAYDETRAFLVALARWTRRPAEWARVPPAAPRAPLHLEGGAPGAVPVAARAPLDAPPRGVGPEVVPGRLAPQRVPTAAALPAWAARQGFRAFAGDFPWLDHRVAASARAAHLDTLADFLEAGAFNVLLTNAHGMALVDSSHWSRWDRDATRADWEQTADRLDATSVRWIPTLTVRDYAADSGYACPLDPRLWDDVLVPALRALDRLAASHADLIPAIGVDVSGTPWAGAAFCDAAWTAALREMVADSGFLRDRADRLAAIPPTERYDSLLAGGLLARYDAALGRVVSRRAATLRTDARRARPDLLFAIVTDRPAVDWFVRGLTAALGEGARPAIAFGPDDGLPLAAEALRVVRLEPGRFARLDPSLSRRVFRDRDGFWIGPAEALPAGAELDLVHQLRRFAKDR